MSRTLSSDRRQINNLNTRTGRLLVVAAAASVLLSKSLTASAAATWTGPSGTASAPTTGDWNTAGNWSPNGVPASSTTTELDFLGTSSTYNSTDDVAGIFQVNLLKFNSFNASIGASSGDSLSLAGTTPSVQQIGAGTVTISAPVNLAAATLIQQVNGCTINFTGPITTGGSNGLTLSNTSGSGNSTVNFTGANTFAGLQINANITGVAGLSSNTTTLGSGTVTLNGGKLSLQGQQSAAGGTVQQAIGVTGFNADTIVDAAAAANPTTSSTGTPLNGIDNANGHGNLFFQNGYRSSSNTGGLPANGVITSVYTNVNGGNTVFNLGYNGTTTDFVDNNTLRFRDHRQRWNIDAGARPSGLRLLISWPVPRAPAAHSMSPSTSPMALPTRPITLPQSPPVPGPSAARPTGPFTARKSSAMAAGLPAVGRSI